MPEELSASFDWLYLATRLLFVALIYLFLWQVARIMMRELQSAAAQPKRTKALRAKLVVLDPAESAIEAGAVFPVTAKATVGRRADCAISIDEPFLSAVHAHFEPRKGAWYVVDHGSTNGTFVNGRAVAGSIYVEDADIVQFGRIKLKFSVS